MDVPFSATPPCGGRQQEPRPPRLPPSCRRRPPGRPLGALAGVSPVRRGGRWRSLSFAACPCPTGVSASLSYDERKRRFRSHVSLSEDEEKHEREAQERRVAPRASASVETFQNWGVPC